MTEKLRDCPRLNETKQAQQFNETCNPGLNPGPEKRCYWDN